MSGPAETDRAAIESPLLGPAAPTPDLALSFEPPEACLTPAASQEWRALMAASDNVYAQYQSPEWFAHLHATHRDKLLPPLVVRDADGRMAGVVPALLAPYDLNYEMRGTSISRSRLRAAAILGGVPLLPPDADLHERAFRAIFREAKHAQCLYLHSVPTSSFLWRYLEESPWIRERFRMYLPDGVRMLHLVRLPATFEAYLAKFKHKKRYNLARQERLLREHIGGRLELRRIERVDQVASFRDAVATVIRDSWQGRVASPEAYTILQDCEPFEDLAERGLIRSYVLECAGTPSAFVLGYQFGDIYHYAEIAYRQQDARFSPGTTLLYLLIQDLITHRSPSLLNFGIGDAVYKREFGTHQFQDASVLLLDRTVRNAAVQVIHSTFQGLVRNVGQRFREIRAA